MTKNINNLLIPQVNKVPDKNSETQSNKLENGQKSEFKDLLNSKLSYIPENQGVRLSNHALKRISERKLKIDGAEYLKLREGINKLKAKGGKESLVVTDNAAYIIDVDKDTVVTAIEKDSMKENVFTNIDSTVFIN